SRISGKPVTSATSRTATPACLSARAVPPVDRISTPIPARPRASSTSPVLSDTERRARRIWLIELIRLALGALPAALGLRPHRYPAARDLESALGVKTDGLRVETVLLGQDPGRQRRLRVPFEHRDGRLQHDRAGVHALVHEVHGGP